jgi:hypothetical protein
MGESEKAEAQGLELRVRPLDTAQPGSYHKRKQILALLKTMARGQDAKSTAEAVAALEAFEQAEGVLIEYLVIPEGMSLDEILGLLSADQFDELLGAILGGAQPSA